MPQLDFYTYASQAFWLFVFFAIFYIAIAQLILPGIVSVIENRSSVMKNNISRAEEIAEQAEILRNQVAAQLNSARKLAHSKVDQIIEQAHKNAAQENIRLDQFLQDKYKISEKRVSELEKEAPKLLLPVSSMIVETILNKLTDIKISNDVIEQELIKYINKSNV
jgi:F-type H+-transporting ATPase subunit b